MKVERKGNVYRKQSWLKEHREELWISACVIMGIAVIVMGYIIGG